MTEIDKITDPVWDYVLMTKLTPYMQAVKLFWENIESLDVSTTGVYTVTNKIVNCDIPAGLMYRVTNTPVRSPIKGVQIFPFVPTVYLQLTNVSGGALRMVSRVCADNRFSIDDYIILEKSRLPDTYHQGQFVAFVPKDVINSLQYIGKWVYLKHAEMVNIMQQDGVLLSVKQKVIKYI